MQSLGCLCVRTDQELSTDHQKCPLSCRKKGLVRGFYQVVLSEAKDKKSISIILSVLVNKHTDP